MKSYYTIGCALGKKYKSGVSQSYAFLKPYEPRRMSTLVVSEFKREKLYS